MPLIRCNGIDVAYDACGSGPPLLLLHPLPFDRHVWLYQIASLSPFFRTICFDLRGRGRSSKPTHAFSLDEMAGDALALLEALEVGPDAILIGCSAGSKIALKLAAERPAQVRAAVLVGGASGPQEHLLRRGEDYVEQEKAGTLDAYRLAHLRHGVTQGFADSALGAWLLSGFLERAPDIEARSVRQVFRALASADLTDTLPQMRTPILIVNGEFDGARTRGERTAASIPSAEHRVLPRAGHCCFLEDPAAFDSVLRDFLVRRGIWPKGA